MFSSSIALARACAHVSWRGNVFRATREQYSNNHHLQFSSSLNLLGCIVSNVGLVVRVKGGKGSDRGGAYPARSIEQFLSTHA